MGPGRRLGRAGAVLTAIATTLFLAGLALVEPLPVKALRNIIFDGFQRAAPRPFTAGVPVVIVDIDDDSLARFGQWPWPRNLIARLLGAIGAHEPAVIAFDMVFAEPDRLSPDVILGSLPPSPGRDALLAAHRRDGGLSNDGRLAEQLRRTPSVLGLILSQSDQPAHVTAGFARAGDDPLPFLPQFTGAINAIAPLAAAATGHGALNWTPEYDHVIRRVPTLAAQGKTIVPSLALEALRVAQKASTIIVKASNASGETGFGMRTGIVSLKVGAIVVPTDGDGALRIRYAGTRPERRISASRLLDGDDAGRRIEGRIVLVGSSAAALSDVRASPIDAAIPGVEVHAEIIEHVLSGARLARPDWLPGAEATVTVFAAALATLIGLRLAPFAAAGVGLALLAAMGWASWYAFGQHDLLIDAAIPSLAGVIAFLIAGLARWRRSDAERRAVRAAFSRYLSPTMVEMLAANPEQLRLGGENRALTILFSDVRGFTGLAESYRGDPQALTTLMNRLLTPLSDAITSRSGTIDKYMGDAVMAFWNAPLDVPDHAALACAAALDMRKRLGALNDALEAEALARGRPHVPIAIGIGINSGDCVVGNMGSETRFDYSVLGDPANVASRLEGLTRHYDVSILVGEATEALVRDRFALKEIDTVQLRGRQHPQRIFALLDHATR